ncbi:hypothetical protein BKA70DRAFT_1299002 [Coprinopsis sp. MPI-PUGE-AT-0042]|nr:hypothetical protein BKA70DRAFT_1299002 [Coprinopsis sp. MPI-PUGE-AT-0042]
MPALANQDRDMQALCTELRHRLVETGEWHHMRTVLQARLGEHGWLDSTANTCKEQAKAMETPSVKALYDEARPNAKNTLPPPIRKEMNALIRTLLQKHLV